MYEHKEALVMSYEQLKKVLAILREIQVKACELPESCMHDGYIISALAGTVEEILSKEGGNYV